MDYQMFYDFVIQEEERLKETENLAKDYRLCKALAACYELHDYLANRIGEMVECGEIEDY